MKHLPEVDKGGRFLADDFVDEDFLCEKFDVGKTTVANWRRKGTGPAWFRLNGRPYFRISDIEEWLATNRIDPAA
ncbi:helix-turn-helix domain-containing protein [Nitrobacter sp.]|uniref:helix-turn-helix transcriptional regulator n=1 Tax=Nitrobacter sp. TaxID=29420 RepID=UPI0029CAB089|nr:helix-turn-helix domain-containing protein [Nitrobacter sp.]